MLKMTRLMKQGVCQNTHRKMQKWMLVTHPSIPSQEGKKVLLWMTKMGKKILH